MTEFNLEEYIISKGLRMPPQVFNVEAYLNSLPDYQEIIVVSDRGLTSLPSLERFYNLKTLNCSNNKLTSLPKLNNTLEKLFCRHNELTELPQLNNSLRELVCRNNKLTKLPELNRYLRHLNCDNNQLTELPPLNESLRELCCGNNQLNKLPEINRSLTHIYCYSNRLFDLPILPNSVIYIYTTHNNLPRELSIRDIYINDEFRREFNDQILIARFKFKRMCLKYKKQFRDWLWVRIRLPKIQQQYHHNNLTELLNGIDEHDEEGFHKALEEW